LGKPGPVWTRMWAAFQQLQQELVHEPW